MYKYMDEGREVGNPKLRSETSYCEYCNLFMCVIMLLEIDYFSAIIIIIIKVLHQRIAPGSCIWTTKSVAWQSWT